MQLIEQDGILMNYAGGAWRKPLAGEALEVRDPATAERLTGVAMSGRADVEAAVEAAAAALPAWRETPPGERVQSLFRLKRLLEEHFEELSRMVTRECGKTLAESRGEVRRGIENIEVACGIPSLMMGYNLEDVAPGIDEFLIRQPVGVVAAITPFNFPAMIPLWFLPYAIACGNTFILKPSERVPASANLLFSLLDAAGLPPGAVNLVNGGRETVEALLDHPGIRAVSFVGSSPVARHVYARAAAAGKRAQCQGAPRTL